MISDASNCHPGENGVTKRQNIDNTQDDWLLCTQDDWLSSSQALQETYLTSMTDDNSTPSARNSPPQSPAVVGKHDMSPHKRPCPDNQQASPGLVLTFSNSLNINTEIDNESPLPRKVPDVRRKLCN